jgi:hypothetical protein
MGSIPEGVGRDPQTTFLLTKESRLKIIGFSDNDLK